MSWTSAEKYKKIIQLDIAWYFTQDYKLLGKWPFLNWIIVSIDFRWCSIRIIFDCFLNDSGAEYICIWKFLLLMTLSPIAQLSQWMMKSNFMLRIVTSSTIFIVYSSIPKSPILFVSHRKSRPCDGS